MKYLVSFLQQPADFSQQMTSGKAPQGEAKAYIDVAMGGFKSTFSTAVAWAVTLGMYKPVVTLDAVDLEDVFERCNSVTGYWPDQLTNASFCPPGKDGHRSMSVGDLIKDEDGNYFAVASMGFEPVSLPC